MTNENTPLHEVKQTKAYKIASQRIGAIALYNLKGVDRIGAVDRVVISRDRSKLYFLVSELGTGVKTQCSIHSKMLKFR